MPQNPKKPHRGKWGTLRVFGISTGMKPGIPRDLGRDLPKYQVKGLPHGFLQGPAGQRDTLSPGMSQEWLGNSPGSCSSSHPQPCSKETPEKELGRVSPAWEAASRTGNVSQIPGLRGGDTDGDSQPLLVGDFLRQDLPSEMSLEQLLQAGGEH